jgi:hypothetical protein
MMPPASLTFSMTTNASSLDADRLRLVIPHWLRVFGESLAELKVVVDPTPPTGRIAALHGFTGSLDEVGDVLSEFARLDCRIEILDLPSGDRLNTILKEWFGEDRPIRCQAGTPIAAFVAAFEAASLPLVLRADCDMLFHEAGWLHVAASLLEAGHADLVEPARCGSAAPIEPVVSTRALMMHSLRWRGSVLPIRAARVDRLRQLHRLLNGRPSWLALEQMLAKEHERGKIRISRLTESLGCSLHVAIRDQARLPGMMSVVASMEKGAIPWQQRRAGFDFSEASWFAGS